MADELFDIRNNLQIGAFQACINEADKLEPAEDLVDERDVLKYRAMVAQGKYSAVKAEISEDSSSDLQAVKRLATYLHKSSDRSKVVAEVKKLQDSEMSMDNSTVALTSGLILAHDGNYEDALRCLKTPAAQNLETLAQAVQTLLLMNRPDVALKELKLMEDENEDATLTILAKAAIQLAKGGPENLKEASDNYEETMSKYTETPLLLNGQATACIARGNCEEAWGLLEKALEKSDKDAETYINQNAAAFVLGKTPEVAARFLSELKDSHPGHAFTKDMVAKEAEFDELCASSA